VRADQLRDVEAHESLWALIPNPTVKLDPRGDTLENPEAHWDVFISHAAEARAIWLGLVLWTRETVSWTWVLCCFAFMKELRGRSGSGVRQVLRRRSIQS
jgi:hypothetical protein